ncbi:rhomboid family intramembrane serine protease [Amycolatopsis sp. NPDC059027]|uniref:rhomboid family intramembrane serine protease n=1 Tax=unclassified Amycolatopsis TaxID=2618356 RepID=UPI00366E64F2
MNQPPNPAAYPQAALPGCWWHPNRPTGLSCARCGRPACPDCLREAAVGFQCTDCVHTGRQEQRRQHRQYQEVTPGTRTIAGARLGSTSVVVPVLIAVNLLVYLITVMQAKSLTNNSVAELSQAGVLWPNATLGGGEWWRLFTSGFLHGGPLHILANMFSLWMVGRTLELVFGKIRFLALYFVSMLGGSTAVVLFDDLNQLTLGASGALFGLIGAFGVIVIKQRLNPTGLLITLALNAYITFGVSGISIFAHVGGLIVGALVTVAILYAPERNQAVWQAAGIAIIVLALIGLLVYRDTQIAATTCGFKPWRGGQVYSCLPPS